MRVFNNISTPIETTLMVRNYCVTEGRFFCHDSAPEDLYSHV